MTTGAGGLRRALPKSAFNSPACWGGVGASTGFIGTGGGEAVALATSNGGTLSAELTAIWLPATGALVALDMRAAATSLVVGAVAITATACSEDCKPVLSD
ncbi:MAG: hypothetical protein U5K75_09175 [Ahrensia sp.]|nr:hypothetical protein [Ahrensia sp.]